MEAKIDGQDLNASLFQIMLGVVLLTTAPYSAVKLSEHSWIYTNMVSILRASYDSESHRGHLTRQLCWIRFPVVLATNIRLVFKSGRHVRIRTEISSFEDSHSIQLSYTPIKFSKTT